MKAKDKEEHLELLNKAKKYFNQPLENIWFDLKDNTFKCNIRWSVDKSGRKGCYFVKDNRNISKLEL